MRTSVSLDWGGDQNRMQGRQASMTARWNKITYSRSKKEIYWVYIPYVLARGDQWLKTKVHTADRACMLQVRWTVKTVDLSSIESEPDRSWLLDLGSNW